MLVDTTWRFVSNGSAEHSNVSWYSIRRLLPETKWWRKIWCKWCIIIGGAKFLVVLKTLVNKCECFFGVLSYRYFPKEALQNYFSGYLELVFRRVREFYSLNCLFSWNRTSILKGKMESLVLSWNWKLTFFLPVLNTLLNEITLLAFRKPFYKRLWHDYQIKEYYLWKH